MNEHPYPLEGKALLTATTGKTLFSRILVECLHTILYLDNNGRSAFQNLNILVVIADKLSFDKMGLAKSGKKLYGI